LPINGETVDFSRQPNATESIIHRNLHDGVAGFCESAELTIVDWLI
jgi:hypothetical protein